MTKISKIEEMSSKLFYNENYKELLQIEKILQKELYKTNNIIEKEYIFYLLLITKIKNNPIEGGVIWDTFYEYFSFIEKSKKTFQNDIDGKKKYILTIIGHLQYLKKMYSDKYFWDIQEKIYIVKNDLKKELFLLEKKYIYFIRQFLYKYITWYGHSYFNLMYTSMLVWFIFAFIYYLNDAFITPWAMISGFPWMEDKLLGSFEYYLYLSVSVLSNLWADFDLWSTVFLRIMISLEQMFGVILTWLFVYTLAKKI